MMANEKASQKDKVIFEMGLLLQPIKECVHSEIPKQPHEYRIALAKSQTGDNAWRQTVRQFTTFPGNIVFNKEFQEISHVPERLIRRLSSLIEDPNLIEDHYELQRNAQKEYEIHIDIALKYISYIPISWEPEIFPANTPFTAYLNIREAVVSSNRRFHYFDRYVKPEFYRLFISELPRNIEIRIVTTVGDSRYGFKAVEDVSNLVKVEFNNYSLIEVSPALIHDRNLRIDDNIFTLGPGIDRAGIALTNFGPSDSSGNAHLELDRILMSGSIRHRSPALARTST